MVTIEEQTTYLAQQLNAMQTDGAELQNAPQGSATRYADPMVKLLTSEPRVRRVTDLAMRQQQSCQGCKLWRREAQVR